jgi:hypothetical protein
VGILPLFNKEYKVSCDYLAWVEIRDLKGSFVYCPGKLLGHRIHEKSETTKRIEDNSRSMEDFQVLRKLSPEPIAKLIHRFYAKSEKSNKSEKTYASNKLKLINRTRFFCNTT